MIEHYQPMEHQVLARKWRPRTFDEMVGQEHVLKALINALEQNRLHHAYLFTGTRGVGKTSIARLLAKCLNCEEGVSAKPCGECASCREIAEGRSVDLIEVDAASRTKVEDTRELLDNVQYAPTRCRYKIYIIDEVHMLSSHSFNALLKTLEEPPPHIKFLLATTDPQKLPVTILSRCLQFNLKNMSPERVVGHLSHVLQQENIEFEEAALWQLGRAAQGSMRDALSLTDQAIAYGNNALTETDVGAMLGTMDQQQVLPIVDALLAADGAAMLAQVATLAEFSPDYESVLEELISILHRVAIAQTVPDATDNSQGDQAKITELAEAMTPADVQLYYQIALTGRRDLPLNPDPRNGLEMVLLRMLAFKPTDTGPGGTKKKLTDTQSSSNAEPSSAPSTQPAQSGAAETLSVLTNSGGGAAALRSIPQSQPDREAEANQLQAKAPMAEKPALNLVVDNAPTAEPEAVTAPIPETALDDNQQADEGRQANAQEQENTTAPAGERFSLKQLTGTIEWVQVAPQLEVSGMTRNILMQCAFVGVEDGKLKLLIDPQFFDLANDSQQQRINQALLTYFDEQLKVVLEAGFSEEETPDVYAKRFKRERQQQAKALLEADPNVQALMQRFDAKLDDDSLELF